MRSFARIASIAKEKIMSLLENMDNPEENLEDAWQKQLELLYKLRDSLHSIRTSRQVLEGQRARIIYNIKRVRRHPHSFPDKNKHSLRVIESLENEIKELKRKENELEALQIQMETQIYYFGKQKDILVKRYQAAKALLQTSKATPAKNPWQDIKHLLEELNDSALFLEAQAKAIDKIVKDNHNPE